VQHLVEQNALGTPVGRHPGGLTKHRMDNSKAPDMERYACYCCCRTCRVRQP
jgi:hypothetical protein